MPKKHPVLFVHEQLSLVQTIEVGQLVPYLEIYISFFTISLYHNIHHTGHFDCSMDIVLDRGVCIYTYTVKSYPGLSTVCPVTFIGVTGPGRCDSGVVSKG